MGRTLFLGDSHAAGYYFKDRPHQWEHNYGDSYSKLYNKDVIVYALPGKLRGLIYIVTAGLLAVEPLKLTSGMIRLVRIS